MFITKKKFDRRCAELEGHITFCSDRYWTVWHKLENLLKYLELEEIHIAEQTKLEKIKEKD